MSNGAYQELQRELAGLAGDVTFIKGRMTARLGDGTDAGDVVVAPASRQYPTFPLFWCYTETNGTKDVFQAVPWYPGLTYDNSQRHMEVVLVRFPQIDPKLWFVFSFTDIGLAAWGGATPAQVGLQQAAAVTPDKILTNSIYFSSGLTLGFRGGTMRELDRIFHLPANASLVTTLSDHIPGDANTERWVNISINSVGVATVTAGDTFPDSETNKLNFVPNTVSLTDIHLGSVLLANGLATGTNDLILPYKDIFSAPGESSSSTETELASLTDVTTAPQTANFVLAAGDGASGGEYRGRLLVAADVPDLPASKITSGTFADARVAESNVTQHEAALTILQTQIPLISVRVTHSANQSIANGLALSTALAFDTDVSDAHGFHDPVTNNSRITIPAGFDGNYLLTANMRWAASSAGDRNSGFRKNGTTILESQIIPPAQGVATLTDVILVGQAEQLVAGDYIELLVGQDSGGPLNNNFLSGRFPMLTVTYLGA